MSESDTSKELQDYLEQYPDTRFMDVMNPDMNGVIRGKRIEFGLLLLRAVQHFLVLPVVRSSENQPRRLRGVGLNGAIDRVRSLGAPCAL